MLLSNFSANDAKIEGLALSSMWMLRLILGQGPEWGYFTDTYESIFTSDTPLPVDGIYEDVYILGYYHFLCGGYHILGLINCNAVIDGGIIVVLGSITSAPFKLF